MAIAERERKGPIWPLLEIFEDKVAPHMKVVDQVVEPIIREALRKNADKIGEDTGKDIDADETLLDHLVKSTTGWSSLLFPSRSMWFNISNRSKDSQGRDPEHSPCWQRYGMCGHDTAALHTLTFA